MSTYPLLFFPLIAFFLSYLASKSWIKLAIARNLVGRDMNKRNKFFIAESGGIAVIFSFVLTTLLFVFYKTFIEKSLGFEGVELFATLLSVGLAGFIGFVDDVLGWKKGLKQWQKPLLTLPIAIPLMAINAGTSAMEVPFFGKIDFGIFYPLVLVPLGIVGASNGFNMLAGFNGLEASMGSLILSTLGIVSLTKGNFTQAILIFSMVAALLAFLIFNKYPAKIFPGDSLTYSVGSFIAISAILGDMEKIAIFLFTPYFIEFILKARSRFKAEVFGIEQENHILKPRYDKIYSIAHFLMKFNMTEKKLVATILISELFLCILSLILIF
jgi:UDP-N-acetylglucosamine--dolichyl-phosphate N-acetylglucosaminephosphotransferase